MFGSGIKSEFKILFDFKLKTIYLCNKTENKFKLIKKQFKIIFTTMCDCVHIG